MACPAKSSPLKIYEAEDDLPCGWYLHRIGRGQKMAIVLKSVTRLGRNVCNSKHVSHKHVMFCLSENGSWFITDLKSKCGTYVNDKLVPEEGLTIQEWDIISLGRKRPRNNDEFAFMLMRKRGPSCSSKKGSNDDTSSSSLPVGLFATNSESKTTKGDESEHESLSGVQRKDDDNNNNTHKMGSSISSTSVIEISESSSSIGKDSEQTVKNLSMPEVQTHDIHVLQQESISVVEKVGAWIANTESEKSNDQIVTHLSRKRRHELSSVGDEKTSARRNATHNINYADSDSDSSSSEKRQRISDEASTFDVNSWCDQSTSTKGWRETDESTSSDTNSWSNTSPIKSSNRSKRYDTRKTQGNSWIDEYFSDSKSDTSKHKSGGYARSTSVSPDERSRKNKRCKDMWKHQKYYKDNDYHPRIRKKRKKTKKKRRKNQP